MADLKTTNIFGDAYINNKVGIATNAPATRLQIGQLSPTAATEGIQFGDDPGTRIYRSSAGTLTLSGSVAGLTLSASTALYGNYGDWSGESNKIQWHSNNLYFVNRGGGSWLFRNSSAANVFSIAADGGTSAATNINAGTYVYAGTYLQTNGNLIYPSGYGATQTLQVGNASGNAWIAGLSLAPGGNVTVYNNLTVNNAATVTNDLTVNGNTYLGNANNDTVYVNDTIRIGATDSGDASLFFGEGSVAGSDYGARWYWDSGYTFYWYTRNNGTDTQLFNYVTNDLSYVNWNRNFNMQNYAINYNGQVHFNAGTRFIGNNTSYLIFQSDSTSAGGLQIRDGSTTTKGYTGYWDSAGGGILNNTGNWAVRYNFGNANSGGQLYGDWSAANFTATTFTGTLNGNANAVSFTEVELNAPVTVSGTWTTGNGSEWGEPKFGTSFNQFRYTDGNGPYVEYNIPANHHACFISQLQWDTGGYADCHGVQSDGDLVFLRRINTRQLVENSNHGNPIQHDGATVTFVGSGLQAFSKIRITNRSGRIHMTGIAFTRQVDDGYEGTGMLHPAQISHQGSGSGLDADLLDGYNSATANTANTIVLRDGSGNFSAGTITAALSGNATTATALTSMNISQFTNNSGYLTSAVTSLAGTTNRITVSGATGAVTLNLPQDIHTGASPTFAGLSLTSVSTTGATITNLTGAYQNTTVYDSPRTQSTTPSRGIRAPASSIQFTDSYAIAPFYTYRSTGDWPVPYGIGWGTGGESSGIFQRYASNGSSFGDMIFYTGNDGYGAFSFRRHTWEGTTYFAQGSGELNTELFRIDWAGNVSMLGTLNGSANSATLYPNNGTYGSWRIGGTRNSWYGLEFESGVSLMANSGEVGFYRNGSGWQMRWYNGAGYIYKSNPGGGTEAVILDSSNASYAWNMNQNVRTTDNPTFGTLQLTRLNFGAAAAAPYAAASGEGYGNGITFGGDENSAAYRIFTGMENIGGNYSKLTLNWHTGIRIGAYFGYGGIRFYNNYVGAGTKVFSIAEGDDNVRVANELFVGTDNIGAYKFMKYGGTRSGDWQLFTTSSVGAGQMNVIQVENIGGGGHTNYPTGVYTYGGVMSWRLPNHSFQLYAAHTGDLAYKTQWNNDNYSGWRRILDSTNYVHAANMNQYVRTTDSPTFVDLFVSGLQIRTASPTITLRDTDHRTGFIHVNSNTFFILTGGTDVGSGNWAQVANSRWPMEINLSNNNATFGGDVNAISYTLTGGFQITHPGSGYAAFSNWVLLGTTGFYSATNSAHIYPNTGTYGSWRMDGSRGGWAGLEFGSGVSLMANSNQVGFHRNGYGWQMWWSAGTGYVHKGDPGGGTQATILDSSNAPYANNMNQYVRTTDTCSFAAVTATTFTGALNGSAASLVSVNTYTVGALNVNGMTQLAGVKETYVAVSPSSNVVTIDLNAGTVFRMTYNSVISSFTISNLTSAKVNSFTLISIASAGAGGITFTFSGYTLKWAGGTAPTATTTAGKFDVFSFIYDGTNWYGFTGGLNY